MTQFFWPGLVLLSCQGEWSLNANVELFQKEYIQIYKPDSPCVPVHTSPLLLGGWVSFARSPSLVSDRFSLHIVNIETLKLFLYLNTCWSSYSYPKNNLLIIIIWVECLYHHRWVKWMKQFMWALHTPTKLLKQGRR